jgi:hypothetical protein
MVSQSPTPGVVGVFSAGDEFSLRPNRDWWQSDKVRCFDKAHYPDKIGFD